MLELKITQVNNGYILTSAEKDEDEISYENKEVIEDNDDNDDKKEAMKRMLERVAEYFGECYDKWSSENLNISWNKKGSKID